MTFIYYISSFSVFPFQNNIKKKKNIIILTWNKKRKMELDKSPIHLIHNTNNPFFLEPSPCHLLKVNVSEHSIKAFGNSCACNIGFDCITL